MVFKRVQLLVFVGVPVGVFFWLVFMFGASGYQYEIQKYKNYIFTISLVLMIQFFILDPIKFVIQAFVQSYYSYFDWNRFREGVPRAKEERDDLKFLKLKVEWLKSRLNYNWRHRDEGLNLFYQNVASDLLVYGRYFVSLVILIIFLNEPLKYYHSDGLRKVITYNQDSDWELANIEDVDHVWKFLEDQLIKTFEGNATNSTEYNWVPNQMSKLLSVMRLEQIRIKKRLLGDEKYSFENRPFLPGWKPYKNYHFQEKYWRIYLPWKPQTVQDGTQYHKTGYFSDYPSHNNYVTLLTRKGYNSNMTLQFLHNSTWLDRHTVALFIGFTLYSVDSNLFSFAQFVFEFTPFGNEIIYRKFESENLLIDWRNVDNWHWVIIIFYSLQMCLLAKMLFLKVRYGSTVFKFWNFFDLLIIISNILVFLFIYLQEEAVVELMEGFAPIDKEKYISFAKPRDYGRLVEIFLALLVFCATIRLWKVLLFARVFRLYIRTLVLGAADIFLALMNIAIFLTGLLISSYLISGPTRTLSHAPLSIFHILSFILGYSDVEPIEPLQSKSKALGVIIYALMVFGVTVVLLNMLITLICIHYTSAKEEERARPKMKLHFWEFLVMEYSLFFEFVHKLKEGLFKLLQKLRFIKPENKNLHKESRDLNPEDMAERHTNQMRRLRLMSEILKTQAVIIRKRMDDINLVMPRSEPGSRRK